jgi:signal transduction histidine kinase
VIQCCSFHVGCDLISLMSAGDGMEYARLDSYRSLLKSQEAERTRIAKELHDDIGQSLTLLGIELELTRSLVAAQSPEGAAQLKAICNRVTELGHAVSLLAHKLHSSELELLGLCAALRGMAAEFAKSNNIPVTCTCGDLPAQLGSDLALNIFRVAQEALENISQQNGATSVDIQLRCLGNSLSLTITDDGVDFSSDQTREAAEMAMANMRERIALAGGKFTILCNAGNGMRIEATAPMQSIAQSGQLEKIAI